MFDSLSSINNKSKILNLIGTRQRVIGENLANVDTPGYTRKEINFSEYLSDGANNLEKKMNAKFGGSPVGTESTGETVNMADEIMEMQKNSLMYSIATRRMSSIITELKTAMNVGK